MEGTDRLKKHIEEATKRQVESILSDAEQEAYSILAQAQGEAMTIRQENQARQKREAEVRERQAQAMASLDKRKQTLSQKQALMEASLAKVMDSLDAMNPTERQELYKKWLDRTLSQDLNNPDSAQSILVGKKDEPWFSQWMEETYPNVAKIHYTDAFSGGFILEYKRSVRDYSFPGLLEQNKLRYQEMMAAILFAPEED
jgi:vacuolar-type H+-ATPase subunit E/Vma4